MHSYHYKNIISKCHAYKWCFILEYRNSTITNTNTNDTKGEAMITPSLQIHIFIWTRNWRNMGVTLFTPCCLLISGRITLTQEYGLHIFIACLSARPNEWLNSQLALMSTCNLLSKHMNSPTQDKEEVANRK